jgi:hypothetical protein
MERPSISKVIISLYDVSEEMDRLVKVNAELERDNIKLSNTIERKEQEIAKLVKRIAESEGTK